MKLGRGEVLGLVFVVASFLVAIALYSRLPDPVPTHWNASLKANGWTPKPWGALLPAIILAVSLVLFLVLPRISPRGFRFETFGRTWQIIEAAILGALFLVTSVSLLAAAGARIPVDRLIAAAIGLLLMILGNFMGKLTRNFFVGIRTPWTIASEEVWLRTHQLGGKLFVLAGALLLIAGLMGFGLVAAFVAVGAAAIVSVVYSYVLYRKIKGFREHAGS